MVSRKYVQDYRLENVENKKGKIATRAVYKGDLFDWEKSEEDVVSLKRMILRTTVLEWLVFILALVINCTKIRVMYVSLPLLAFAFPLLGQSRVVAIFFKKVERGYKREEKDLITSRLVSYVFISLFFLLCSASAHIVAWIREGESVEDALLLSLTVALLFMALSIFKKRKDLEMKKIGDADDK